MQDSLVGRGNVAATRMTRNSASMQNLQVQKAKRQTTAAVLSVLDEAAGHAAALADGLVGIEGARSSGRLGAATRSSASHGGSRGMKNETGVGGGGRLGTGDTSSTAAVAAAAATASGSADTMLGVMLGGGGGGGGSGGSVQKKQKPPGLRRGKWTTEEEKYANRLIHEFKAGLLPLTDGTTLRTFLSIMLNCDPMRISKKFVGSNCIGKQVFRRHHNADSDPGVSEEAMGKSWMELADLERNFLERVAETTSKLKHGGAGAAAAASGYGRSPLFGHAAAAAAAPPPTTRTSGAAASSEQMGLRSNSGSWRRGVDDNESDVKPSVNGAGGKQAFGEEQSGQNCRSSTTNSTPAAPTTLANPPTTTRQRKLRSRPQLQQPAPPQQQQDARRERTSQNSSKAPRKKGGKSSGAETNPEGENDERTVRGVVEPGDGVSPNARTSSAASNTSPATGRPSGVDGSRKRGICPGASPGGRGRKPKISARRVKGEGVGKGKEDLAGGERRAEAGGGGGAKVATASAPQQRRQKQLEEKREEQEKEQQQLHEEQRLLQQQQESLQMQQQVLLQQHYHQQQAFMQQQIQQQQQQQPAIGNPAFGFDSDGGPVPRVQSLNTLPSNPPISGSVSVQNLAMLLGMGGASGGGVEACGGNSSSSGVGGGGDGTSGVVSNNFQAAADLAGVAGAMRSTPSSMFLRNNFGQMADIQVENMNLLHLQPQQQQPQLTIPLHGPTNISGGTDGGPGGIGVAMPGGGNIVGGMNTMQMVVPHLFGVRRTSAEDFLSLLQDSEELQAREAQQVREESEERSQSPLTAGQGPPRLSSPLPSGPGLAPLSASVEHVPQGGQIGKPSAAGRGTAEGDDNDLSPPLADASTGGGCSIGVGVDGIGGGNCTRAGERMDGRGKAELTAFVNGGCVGGGGGMEARGAGRGIILGIVPGSGTVPGTREIVEDDQGSEDMYLVGETAEREEDEDEQERDGTGDIAGVLSNGLRAGGGTGHLELKMGLDQESC